MAILKTLIYPIITHALLEDPVPGTNKIFMQFDAYDKNTLAPLFNKGVNHDLSGTGIAGFGISNSTQSDGSRMFRLGVTGNITDVQVQGTGANISEANIDPVPFLSMDTTRPIRKVRYDTNGVSSAVGMFMNKIQRNNAAYRAYDQYGGALFYAQFMTRLNPVSMDGTLPAVNNAYTQYANDANTERRYATNWYPVYFNASTGNMVCVPFGRSNNPGLNTSDFVDQYMPGASYGVRITNYLTTTPTLSASSTGNNNKTSQFLGVDLGGRALFFHNEVSNDFNQQVIRYFDSDNTASVLFNNTTAPTAAGTSGGGNRAAAYGNYVAKYGSDTFNDPLVSNGKAWYAPYFDINGKYHPHYFQWDTATDTFTRNSDITVNWGAQLLQSNVWEPDSVTSSSLDVRHGLQRLIWNETWTIDVSVGVTKRYLMLTQFHGTGVAYDTLSKQRTFVVFTVDPVSPKTLTYHSHVVIPTTPKNMIYFNDAKTQMGIIGENSLYVYAFNDGTGWSLTGTVPYRFSSVGIDALGRIWALSAGATGYGELHLITVNVPVSIAVTAATTEYNYTGTDINTSIKVNAYDTTGARKALSVKLVIDGGSMTFTGSNLTTTITTSASADTTVPVIITGSGISNIIASVVL